MLVGLYTSVTGKTAGAKNLEVISRNLANVNTTGFKKNIAAFRTFTEEQGALHGASTPKLHIDHSQGNIKSTGNRLDLAIHGDGYFVLESEEGRKYSRNGHFLLNNNMEIVNGVGWKLRGRNGVIMLPRNANDIFINNDGSVAVDGVNISRLDIADFDDKELLKEAGNSSFELIDKNNEDLEKIASNYEIQQGYLETSNVNVIDEMVSLMSNMRSFEGNNNVNKTFDRTLDKLIRTASSAI